MTAFGSSILTSRPPAAWFDDPGLDEPTPLTVTDDGQVYGHAAVWGTCHVGIQGACVTPPFSRCAYSRFMLGGRRTSEGEERAVGTITLGTTHADLRLNAAATQRHYEDTGYAVADVAMGEDSWGPWMAGAVRRGITEEQVEELRAAKVSGDWRADEAGHLELVGLLAVNVPGFPVERARARLVASATGEDRRVAMVAANPVPRSPRVLAALVAGMAAYQAELEKPTMDDLLLRVQLPTLLARARG